MQTELDLLVEGIENKKIKNKEYQILFCKECNIMHTYISDLPDERNNINSTFDYNNAKYINKNCIECNISMGKIREVKLTSLLISY
jgi:hypothetical protein